MNWELKNRDSLKRNNNYTHRAKSHLNYFINLRPNVLARIKSRANENFNIVVIGDKELEADYFIIPYSIVSHLLTKESLTEQKRWLINIIDGEFTVFPGGHGKSLHVNVSKFYSSNHPTEFV
jgi:hypothetical protein